MATALTIGNFDGVHRGHRSLLDKSREIVGAQGEVHALFFDPHPAIFFQRGNTPLQPKDLLTSTQRRSELLQSFGADVVDRRAFDSEFAAQSPEAFVEAVVVKAHRADHVVVGPDFRFGAKAAGDVETLVALGQRHGFEVDTVDAVLEGGAVISSTRIRALIREGRVADASALLARFHDVDARVVQGDQRGRTIGFPTANLDGIQGLIPADGVYAVRATVAGTEHGGMANIGTRPTFAAGRSVEVHLFDFDADIYGADVRVAFLARLRGETKFNGVEALVAQLRQDETKARELLARGAKPWT